MNVPDIQELLLPEYATLRQAIKRIDANAQGIAFVTGEGGRLVGVLTDGDIRRGLLRGADLSRPIHEVMQRNFLRCPVDTPEEEVLALLETKGRHIPLVDAEGRPVDYACAHRLRKTPVLEPSLSGNELAYVTECIKTNWISSQGKFIRMFEQQFVDYCDAPHALAVSNGTVALHLALVSLGVGPGDEVLVPDLTFAACANAVIHAGAVPVLVDVDPETWTMDPSSLESAITPRSRAVMPVHLYGHPCDLDPIMTIARRKKLLVVEDCAEALGSRYRDLPVGSLGDAATFSFFGNKTVTTGEGGMVLLRDGKAYERALRLRDHGMDKEKRYWHPEVGFNYRMTNLQAAVGVAQMERIDSLVSAKRRVADVYSKAFAGDDHLQLPVEKPWAKNSYWLYSLMLKGSLAAHRDQVIKQLLQNGIEARPVFYALHQMPPYRGLARARSLEVSERLAAAGLSLPSSVGLEEPEQRRVIGALASLLRMRALMRSL